MATSTQPQQRKSPVDKPLNLPGQSLRDQLIQIIVGDELAWQIITVIFILLTALVWLQYLGHAEPTLGACLTMSAVAVVSVVATLIKIRSNKRKIEQIQLGIDGEIVVGQFLDEHCRVMGYHVLHDVPGEGFNIDHVLIGPGGIFSIETKTHSKPAKGQCIVRVEGTRILVDGHTPDRDPLVQAQACASHIRAVLSRLTDRDPRSIPIRAVVIYPGWYVKGRPANRDIWVLNEKNLPSFLDYEPDCLTREDIGLYNARLSDEVRRKAK